MTDHITSSDQTYPGPSLPTIDHIRLLVLQPGSEDEKISCELVVSDLDSALPYESLSYTWGDRSNRSLINIFTSSSGSQKTFPVTSNCYSALSRLRLKSEPRILWIDAVCIDQDNVSEKNHQVGLMSKIYSRAANVVIHLGDAGQDSDMAIDFIKECDDPTSDSSSLSHPKSDALVQALGNFFRRNWFTRIWVIQEAMLPPNGIVYCGSKSLSWSAILNFSKWNTDMKWMAELPYVVSSSKQSLSKIALHSETGTAMLKTLIRTRYCGATDPRDKIYALLPLLPLLHNPDSRSLTLTPRYDDPLVKVYTDSAVALLRDSGFEILRSVQGGSKIYGLPSWVPDWSVPPQRQMLDSAYRVSSSGSLWRKVNVGDVAHTPEIIDGGSTLRVHGYSCGKIAKMSSIYRAGEGIFPLREWITVVRNFEPAASIDRKSVSNYDMIDDPRECLKYHFYATICAAGFSYDDAIQNFIRDEEEKDEDSLGDIDSKTRWEDLVRIEASKHRGKPNSGDAELHFTGIPFHLAATKFPPSYRAYVQYVLKNCHSRHFMVTEKGYMGLVPDGAEIGDEIIICVGAKIPFAFRKVKAQFDEQTRMQFQLIGECSVEEIAWESLRHKSFAVEEIHIL
ncbi:heterokaryon incompatibility protein-domain-containing protein [Paraphoma chrysanthemicola]|uniref:Heterokaryon incompatibility protein-domain-containing protein n=1 Tax=Paraphoma chrysanthemicola TaxID=798071 RepID=A0A8K0VSF9_9PLEO|nr:heterokaryon incompatibility protein-domain-containing protein [Paraphoma chrysanthemicola]